MLPQDSNHPSATQRLDLAIRRERLRSGLTIAGVALVIAGTVTGTGLFGPSASSAAAIPKADPFAGLRIAQALPTRTAHQIGVVLGISGLVLLSIGVVIRRSKSPNPSLERTREG